MSLNHEPIKEFKGIYRFMSNFYMCPVQYEGYLYPSSEHAYMAAKTTDGVERRYIASLLSPKDAKAYGRQLKLRDGWEGMKQQVMREILLDKFKRNTRLTQLLLATGDQQLIEGNWWGDKIWGVCLKTNVGQNLLGKALMQIRTELQQPKLPSITVVNKHHKLTGEYIGRGSPLGNQWTHLDSSYPGVIKVASREIAIAQYQSWLTHKIAQNDKAVCDELNRLVDIAHRNGELNLMCTCKPKACHGDVIREVILLAWR